MPKISAKIHESVRGNVLAAADSDLIGKHLTFDGVDIYISESFYRKVDISDIELVDLLNEYDNCNLFGNYTVGVAIKNGFVDKETVMLIDNIMHVILIKL
ncbi:MAG: DUF424 family protein [Thermoplasmata archaeon]